MPFNVAEPCEPPPKKRSRAAAAHPSPRAAVSIDCPSVPDAGSSPADTATAPERMSSAKSRMLETPMPPPIPLERCSRAMVFALRLASSMASFSFDLRIMIASFSS